ncbi:PEP/pyruvate-binding domain-containing protein [Paenibacillus riograndensis]|uniref:Pyruvate phosphate dikinase PEP/pyruvate-binding n=1 Tax=Paenibacillus riograndensis SBR5 TaxID=1073571 RepID=A0A0E4HE98_9BACL|nr:PEP/pyruvate-binding domain-containing protein [Paenibacillus riograndensis]CQR58902.1 pyruvate phosphate dikinase PEP/pyruvate-binding [Paenibacillus riograndensis SBR5]
MSSKVAGFREITPQLREQAGGKGAMLSLLYQQGYPVPEGFVVFPEALQGGVIEEAVREEILAQLSAIRSKHPGAAFAVRSSGLGEDAAGASFAGEFESVLGVETDDQLWAALDTVYQSQFAERVQVYNSSIQGDHEVRSMAVVIQRMILSELSGVLFTADPITGSRLEMQGNYVHGLGEQLVSGEANANVFTVSRPKGRYKGPLECKKIASRLYRYARRIERQTGCPQDIEWAAVQGKVYLLQARPITTLSAGNLDHFECNDSMTGDFLWTNTNVGESIADVFTPLSWSFLRALDEEHNVIPGHYLLSGNICGRVYSNISLPVSVFSAFGLKVQPILRQMSDLFGPIPEGASLPKYPFNKLELIRTLLPRIVYSTRRTREAVRNLPRFVKETPEWCKQIRTRLEETGSREELLTLWERELWPRNVAALWAALEGASAPMQKFVKFKKKLIKQLGSEDAEILLSSISGGTELESLGPVLGISRILKNEMSHEEYLQKYGHRGPHEFELSIAEPAEDEFWLTRQLEQSGDLPIQVEELVNHQQQLYDAAWKRAEGKISMKREQLRRRIQSVAEGPKVREAVRSEWTRVFRLNRAFALKAGQLAGIGEEVFFLYLDEILKWLADGDLPMLQHVAARKETYAKYQALPPLPSVIRGRFDPFLWSKDPDRRVDAYDSEAPVQAFRSMDADVLRGFPGAAGRVEGIVRVLATPAEGKQLLPGEILVAAKTNVGWTLCFPKAAAIITDIGAPLSHAAIVARELGIPAVVGCGDASVRLKTGDRVIVDGAGGSIQIISGSGGDRAKLEEDKNPGIMIGE